jgi:ABC-2 type transport system ATP-binding protein
MQMRLGFAVAAFLDADVLLVDEVLAVGDAGFQQKCLDRMRWVLNQGTTLVLVSHDLPALEATCARGIWLRSGKIVMDGPIREVLRGYRSSIEDAAQLLPRRAGNGAQISRVEVRGADGGAVRTGEDMEITIAAHSEVGRYIMLAVGVSEGPASPIWVVERDLGFVSGETEARCKIGRLPLPRGRYALWACLFQSPHGSELLPWHPIARFEVYGPELDPAPLAVVRLAPVHVDAAWEVSQVEDRQEAAGAG